MSDIKVKESSKSSLCSKLMLLVIFLFVNWFVSLTSILLSAAWKQITSPSSASTSLRGDLTPVLFQDSSTMGELPARQTNRPLIGILTVPVENDSHCVSRRRLSGEDSTERSSCFSSLYVKWVESMGGRIVPIMYDLPISEINELLRSVNGFLFSGGDVLIQDMKQEYMVVARHILEFVKQQNDNGIYYPLWGTCMGIQTLSVLVGGPKVLEYHIFKGVDPAMLPLNFTQEAKESRLFGSVPADRLEWFATKNVTTNYHHDGVDPKAFTENEALADFFNVLAVNEDSAHQPFVSVIEAKRYPIWGVQFHPERPQFEYNDAPDPVNHDLEAVLCNAWLSEFFVDQARRNNLGFSSIEKEKDALIFNHAPVGKRSGQTYYFPKP